ncbi:unnamed protein product [Arctogadus glacialis]
MSTTVRSLGIPHWAALPLTLNDDAACRPSLGNTLLMVVSKGADRRGRQKAALNAFRLIAAILRQTLDESSIHCLPQPHLGGQQR